MHTGRSPPEEEQSFHSVRVHAACGGETTHPPLGRLVEKNTPGDGPTTLALLRFMRPIHFLPGCALEEEEEEEAVFIRGLHK